MRYQYLTLNTGHVSRHDTDVDLDADVIPLVRDLLQADSGTVPGTDGRITYRFTAAPELAACALSTQVGYRGEPAPVWTAFGYLDDRAALTAHEELFRTAARLGIAQRDLGDLCPPGLVLVLYPTAVFAGADDLFMLADFAKTMFAVWALSRAA